MNITPEEAAEALREIESSRLAMRSAIQSHRGHYYLWLWGFIWILTSIVCWYDPTRFWPATALSGAGIVASFIIASLQGSRVRSRIDKRFVWVCVATLVFGYGAWPIVLGPPHSYKSAFGFGIVIWMQLYVIGGIWFDNYLLWVGIAVTALTLAALLFFPGLFWGFTLLCGVTLVATGYYIRYFWR